MRGYKFVANEIETYVNLNFNTPHTRHTYNKNNKGRKTNLDLNF